MMRQHALRALALCSRRVDHNIAIGSTPVGRPRTVHCAPVGLGIRWPQGAVRLGCSETIGRPCLRAAPRCSAAEAQYGMGWRSEFPVDPTPRRTNDLRSILPHLQGECDKRRIV